MSVEQGGGGDIGQQTEDSHGQHGSDLDLDGADPAFNGLVEDKPRKGNQRDGADEAGQDLEAPVAEGLVWRGRAGRDENRRVGQRDRQEMGQKVKGVVHQGQGAGEIASDSLGDHDNGRNHKDPAQPAAFAGTDGLEGHGALSGLRMVVLLGHPRHGTTTRR
jgi:hypothetical protein